MKKRKAKSSGEEEYNTFSITMELERPLLYNDENYIQKENEEKKILKAKARKKSIILLL